MPQDYDAIVAQCKSSGTLFEDPDFPAVDASTFFSHRLPRPFVWKRPKDIVANPTWISDKISRFDVNQGILGDDWLLAAISTLTFQPALINRVVDPGQSFDTNYYGVFRFRIWQFGEWTEVVVDDRLPTLDGKLVFMHSKDTNEFWSPLLEKAYAKLNGSYESLKGGQTTEAMCDFTGGISENYALGDKAPKDLFKILLKASARSSLMGCSITAKPNEIEAKLANGLLKGHAYSITGVRKITARTRKGDMELEMVRVRNPWGNEREWSGAWGDKSREWAMVADDERRAIGLTFDTDGEFWMSFQDWKTNFTIVEICNLGAQSMAAIGKTEWESFQDKGDWKRGITAGGSRNYINSFASNPQFRITLNDTDDDEDDLCSLVVAVMQIGRRKLRKIGAKNLTIGFTIYKVPEEHKNNDEPLDKNYFLEHMSSARSESFLNSREISGRFKIPPGDYVVIPSTFDPNEEGDFLIRMFSEKPQRTRISDEPTRYTGNPVQPERTEQDKKLASKFQTFFLNLAGRDEAIDAYELQALLSAAFKSDLEGCPFSIEGAKGLINLRDNDKTGKLEYEDFKAMWLDLKEWQKIFKSYDSDKNGNFNVYELREALRKHGFRLSNDCLRALTMRFNNNAGKLDFNGYMMCIIRIRALFASLDVVNSGYKQMTPDTVITNCVGF